MHNAFLFSPQTKHKVRYRQNGKCACCGVKLDNLVEHAHHVIPNQSGNPINRTHQWLSTEENCVILCVACHERAHQNGKFRSGAVAPANYFPYSHGGNSTLHHKWATSLENNGVRTIWPKK